MTGDVAGRVTRRVTRRAMGTAKLLLGTNLKMYKTSRETAAYLTDLMRLTEDISRERVEIFVIPSYTSLPEADRITDRRSILLGAQNMCWEEDGPFTGEISPKMLREFHVDMVEIGHSERRHVFGEDDAMVNRKTLRALQSGFIALVCVGETAEDKANGVGDERVRSQVFAALAGVGPENAGSMRIAYEPVWAIGENSVPATAEYVAGRRVAIRTALCAVLGKAGEGVPVLYGGSVHAANAAGYLAAGGMDGLFIGRAAWDASRFAGIIRDLAG